jgi:hypothetical protein
LTGLLIGEADMKKLMIAVAVAGLWGAAPSFAQPATQASTDVEDQNRIICRSERVIGSRSQRRRLCATRREWQDLADRQRREQGDMLARMTETACRGSGSEPQCSIPTPANGITHIPQ